MSVIPKSNALALARFMATPEGRGIRIAAGLLLIGGGLRKGDLAGRLIAVAGLVPLLAGSLNICVLGPLLDVPADGNSVR